tara:strand:- start:361 stop:849 length:489 start_codon:yes stop_codon:yes gene_type:complete
MASIINVDKITEATSGNGVHIPGHVIQVVQTVHTATTNITSTSEVEYSGITTSITPKATGSHILCKVVITAGNNHNGGLWYETFLRNPSNLVQDQRIYFNSQYEVIGPRPFYDIIDTTATTAGSARTYKVFAMVSGGATGELRINWAPGNQFSSMTLMEIAQ